MSGHVCCRCGIADDLVYRSASQTIHPYLEDCIDALKDERANHRPDAARVAGDDAADAKRWRAVRANFAGIDFSYEGVDGDIIAAIIHLPDERYPVDADKIADVLVAQHTALAEPRG